MPSEYAPNDEPNRLRLPNNSFGEPAAGRRVAITPPEYADTAVHHMLYLPAEWGANWRERDERLPIVCEYTGNYFPTSGSTGKVEEAALGYGISGGKFILVALPYISNDGSNNERTWWGDIAATVTYAKLNVPRIIEAFGGDPDAVLLCGFSRGAIAVNYIGLHDDEIAALWSGFITHDHYDGEREWSNTNWGTPLKSYRQAARTRLARLHRRPFLVCQNGGTQGIEDYLKTTAENLDSFSFLPVDTKRILGPFPNEIAVHEHNDRWMEKDSTERNFVWQWVNTLFGRD